MQNPQLAPRRSPHARRPFSSRVCDSSTKSVGRSLLALALLTQGIFFGAAAVPRTQAQTTGGITGTRGTTVAATVDVSVIAQEDELAPDASNNEPRVIHKPMSASAEGQ